MTKPIQPGEVHFTHIDYTNVPDEFRPLPVLTKNMPKAVTAAYFATEDSVVVALALTSKNDIFSRKKGREIASARIQAALTDTLTDKDKAFIRVSPALSGEALETHIRRTLAMFGFASETEEGKELAALLTKATPLCQTVAYITEYVRVQLQNEFGPTEKTLLSSF